MNFMPPLVAGDKAKSPLQFNARIVIRSHDDDADDNRLKAAIGELLARACRVSPDHKFDWNSATVIIDAMGPVHKALSVQGQDKTHGDHRLQRRRRLSRQAGLRR